MGGLRGRYAPSLASQVALWRLPRVRYRRRRWRYGARAASQRGARIALKEVAIGESQACDRATEAVVIDLLHPEARIDQHAGKVRTHRRAAHLDGAGRQGGKPYLGAALRLDRSDDRAILEDAAETGGSIEAIVGKQLAGDERAGLLGCKLLGSG